MEWETDRSLQARMAGTVLLIAALPLGFTVTMTWALNNVVRPLAEDVTESTIPAVRIDPLIVLGLTIVGLVIAYVRGGQMAMGSVGARTVTEEQAPQLHARVDRLAATAGVPAPDVAVVDSAVPNAFATGRARTDSTVVVTSALREVLGDDELDAVLAHELSHVHNRDATVMSVAYLLPTFTYVVWQVTYKTLKIFFRGLGNVHTGGGRRDGRAVVALIVVFLATVAVTITVSAAFWVASTLLFRLLSQYREFAADRGAAAITGDPLALASALETIDDEMADLPDRDLRGLDGGAEALYISSLDRILFDEDDDSLVSQDMFPDSHPPTDERVERLREIAGTIET